MNCKILLLPCLVLGSALALPAMAGTGGKLPAAPFDLNCAGLSVSGTGAPGTDLTFSFSGGAPASFAVLVVGAAEGSFSLTIGALGTLDLGIAAPFVPVPMGRVDTSGNASVTLHVPPHFPQSKDLFAQGLSASLTVTVPPGPPSAQPPVSLSFCTSNVVSFHVGP